jgi:hypothetical protein
MYGFTSFTSQQPSSGQQRQRQRQRQQYDADHYVVPPIIQIDGITFTIICKSQQVDTVYYEMNDNAQEEMRVAGVSGNPARFVLNSRDMICFISSALPGVLLYAYRSSSELGIWRLAFIDANLVLYKGILDYVQGTLIHHYLIGLINTQWDFIPHIDETIISRYPTLCWAREVDFNTNRYGSRFCLVTPYADSTIRAMIDDSRRARQFAEMNPRYTVGSLFLNLFTGFVKSHDNPLGITINCSNRDKNTLHTMYHMLKNGGEEMRNIFDINYMDIVSNYQFAEQYARIRADVRVGTQRLIKKVDPSIYCTLVFCLYEATYGGGKTVSGSYGIALLPSDSTVTPYGIYSHYVSANLFICKPFFYTSMCHQVDAQTCELLCDKEYLYSGFIYEECWPYNEIAQHAWFRGFNYSDGKLQKAILNVIQNKPVDDSSFRLRQTPYNPTPIMGGRGNPHKKRKSRKHKKTHKKRKSQKKRKTTYSIFRSNK